MAHFPLRNRALVAAASRLPSGKNGKPIRALTHASSMTSNRIEAYNFFMDHSKLVVAQVFGSQGEAELAKGMLESAGIRAIIQADTAGGMDLAIAWSDLGFRVLVREEDALEAREVLNPPQDLSAESAPPTDENSSPSN